MAIELTTTNAEVKVEGTEALTTLTVNQAEVTLEVAQSGPQGVGVPAGGTTGQVLAKASGTNYDTEWVTGGGGGVTDHGALTGLADDDHTQYLTAARGDARYDDLGQDSAATGLYAFSDFGRMTAGTIHNQQSSGSAIGDPVTWIDGRTSGGAGIDAFIEVCEIVSGVLRHRGTRLSAVGSYLLPGGALGGTPAHGTAHTATVGCVADTTQAGENGPSFVRLGFLDGDNSNGYLGYLKAASSSANHEVYIVRDDAGVPGWSTTPVSLGRRLGPDDRFTFTHYGNTFAVLVNGVEVTRVTETTYSAATFNVTTIVLSSEGTSGPPPGANLPGVAWHALSTGSPLEPTTPRTHAATHQDGGSDELALDASQTTTGVFDVARIGTGTPSAFTFLDGTGAWTDNVPVYVPVKNTSGSQIDKGAPVYATGTVGSTYVIEIAPADADVAAAMPALGLLESTLAVNGTGYAVITGTLRGVATDAYSIGQELYVSTTAGQLTSTKPTGSTAQVQSIGVVTRVNANNGEILVGIGHVAEAPNSGIDGGAITSGTVGTARLSLPVRRLAGTGISYTSATDLFGTPPTDIQGNVTTSALDAGRMRMTPCDIAGGPTLSTIGFEVSASALSAGQSVTIGCYARASTGLPTGNPLWSHSVTVGTTTGTYNVSTTNALPEGGCWLAFLNPSGNAGSVTIYIYQPVSPYLLAFRSVTNRPALISTTGISALPDVSSYTVSNASSASTWGYAQQGTLFMLR